MRAGEPRVSIVLPTHDRADLVERSIRTVLDQTFPDFELIVVDDASNDGTPEVVAAIEDPRMRLIRLADNRGAGGARNEGIRHARAALLAFQDSDDEWMPHKLEKQLVRMEAAEPTTCMVYCDMERVHRDGRVTYHRSPDVVRGRLIDPHRGFYHVYGLGIQSTLIRREHLEQVGLFDERYRCFEDLELFLRLSRHFDFEHLEEPLVRYHESVGVSSNRSAELHARTRLLGTHLGRLARNHRAFLFREARTVLGERAGNAARRVPMLGRLVGRLRLPNRRNTA